MPRADKLRVILSLHDHRAEELTHTFAAARNHPHSQKRNELRLGASATPSSASPGFHQRFRFRLGIALAETSVLSDPSSGAVLKNALHQRNRALAPSSLLLLGAFAARAAHRRGRGKPTFHNSVRGTCLRGQCSSI